MTVVHEEVDMLDFSCSYSRVIYSSLGPEYAAISDVSVMSCN